MNRRLVSILVLGAALLGAGGVLFWRRAHRPVDSPSNVNAYVVVSGDTALWLTPCGCTTNQSGGLPRRGTYLAGLKKRGPVVYADVGGAAGGSSEYFLAKWQAILRGELLMGLRVQNIGASEAALGPAILRDVGSRLETPLVSANVRDGAGILLAPAYRVVNAGGKRWALVGLLSQRYAKGDIQVDDPCRALLSAIAQAKGQYDALIVLAYMPADELQALAANVPEVDAVVGGPTLQPIPPQYVGTTLLMSATSKGKFMAQIAVPPPPGQWVGRIVELDSHFADDAGQLGNVRAFLAELGRRDFSAQQSGLVTADNSAARAGYEVAGSAACTRCHSQAHAIWSVSSHAHAWHALSGKGNEVDPFCQQCHTTDYGLPGGFVCIADNANRTGVGCENCHGPSQAHVGNPALHTPFLPRDQCVRCHDAENSPGFKEEAAWKLIRHTKDAATAPTAPSGRALGGEEVGP